MSTNYMILANRSIYLLRLVLLHMEDNAWPDPKHACILTRCWLLA